MASKYEMFDRSRLVLQPLSERDNLTELSYLLTVGEAPGEFAHPAIPALAERIMTARQTGSAVVLMMGAHVIKEGLSRYIIDLMRRRLVDVVALNGAGVIHDFELARMGATSEDVARYIKLGQFGMWTETGRINDIVAEAQEQGLGFGEAVGRFIAEGDFPHRDVSILAAGYELSVPVTVHFGIGVINDI